MKMLSLATAAMLTFGLLGTLTPCHAGEAKGIAALAGEGTPLAKGERIVFFGDSITQAGADKGGYVWLIQEAMKAKVPDLDVSIIGAGISGHKVPDLQARLERDVLSKQPTVVFIYIGINDVWHSQNGMGTPKDRFESGLKEIITQLKDAGATVVLATPSVIGEKAAGSNKLDAMLAEYAAISRAVAKEHDVQLCDLQKAFADYLKEHNQADAENGVLTSDGVHLNEAGNQFVADRAAECIAMAVAARSGSSAAESEEGFTNLLDDELSHWQLLKKQGPGYLVKDGVLVCPAEGGGNLFSKKEYANFIFRFEFKLTPDGNNGIAIRTPLEGDPAYVGMETQVLDDDAEIHKALQPYQYHGSLYGIVPAKRGAQKLLGEWNSEEIVCDGPIIKVKVNGQVTMTANLDEVKDEEVLKAHPGVLRPSGHIGFLGHGTTVEFRNIRIKELP